MKHLLYFPLIIILLVSGCKPKSDVDPTNSNRENILSDNAHIVDAAAVAEVSLSSLKLSKSKLAFKPAIGDIILASPSDQNPQGVIAKITSVTESGDVFSCNITPSNLNEAFKQLYIYYEEGSGSSNLRKGEDSPIREAVNYNWSADFSVKGQLQLNVAKVKIHYYKKEGSIEPDTLEVLANINSKGSGLEVKCNGKLKLEEKTIKSITSLPILYVPVPIGGVILTIPFRQVVDLNTLPLTVDGKMKASVVPVFSASVGVRCINGDCINLSGFELGASVQKPIRTDFDASMQANLTFITPVYKIGPLFTPSNYVYGKLPNQLECKIQTATPNYAFKYKLDVEVGMHYDFWFGKSGNKSFPTQNLITRTILEGDWDKGHVMVDFSKLPPSAGRSITLEGITFKILSAPGAYDNPTGIPPSPDACAKLDDTRGSFIINNFGVDSELNYVYGLRLSGPTSMAGPGMLGADLSKFSKVDSIRVVGYDMNNYSFLSVCDSSSNKGVVFGQNGRQGYYTRTIKIGTKVNRFLYYSSSGYLHSIEIFHK